MANTPVIFDDGGSTRIKQLLDGANLDGLLGTLVTSGTPGTPGAVSTMVFEAVTSDQFNGGGTLKCHMKIRSHQIDGDQQIFPAPAVPGGSSGVDLQTGDQVIITSQNGQVATITFNPTLHMVITLTASLTGLLPIVEAKQNLKQRRYVVSNAGAISTVELSRGGATTLLFSLTASPSIYTMVHLR